MAREFLSTDEISKQVNSKIIESPLSGTVKVFLLNLEPVITDQIQGLIADSSLIDTSSEDVSPDLRKMRQAIKENPILVADLYISMGEHIYHSILAEKDPKFRKKAIEERLAGNGLLGIASQAFTQILSK